MSIRNAGSAIREARLKAGLTQEKLSEGICSPLSLSRIENGTIGVSPSTFQALMAHAGAPCEVFPIFENWTDYECFFHLKHARFHLNAWQLSPAYEELNLVEEKNWNKNKFYYQEWALMHGILQFRSGLADHTQLYDFFLGALHMSRPEINLDDFKNFLLSITEIELLIYLAQEALYLNKPELCNIICAQIQAYLSNSQLTFLERDHLLAEYAVVYAKYLIAIQDYEAAFQLADENRHRMVTEQNQCSLFELIFLCGLSCFYQGNIDSAIGCFKCQLYSLHAMNICFFTKCRNYVQRVLSLALPENLCSLPDIEIKSFTPKILLNISDFSNGIYSIYQSDIVTIGTLIHQHRLHQKLSQKILCQGICSTSKLSKIENGSLQPDVFLAEALLERLGFSSREFIFRGNAEEAKIHDLKTRLHLWYNWDIEKIRKSLDEFYPFTTDKNAILLRQHYLYIKAKYSTSPDEKAELLCEALTCTLPAFDIYCILNYRLSSLELTILNNLAYTYKNTDTPYKSVLFFRQLLLYYREASPDIILKSQCYSITLWEFCNVLYTQKYYKELIDLFSQMNLSIFFYASEVFGSFYFYYCQALGEYGHYKSAASMARYSCALEISREADINVPLLISYLSDDFHININY